MAKKGDGIKTTQYTASGESKGWDNVNNRWETDEQFYARTAHDDSVKQKQQKTELTDKISNFKNTDFNYDANNPYLETLKSQLQRSGTVTKQDVARQLASRGMTDSGEAIRQGSRIDSQIGQSLANAGGQDYLRQLNDWKQNNSDSFSRLLSQYNISNQEYQNSMNEYYQNQAIQSQKEMQEYQRQQNSGFDWSSGLSGALNGAGAGASVGTAIAPGVGTAVGAGLGALTGLFAGGL